jgi:hypothetical protein
MGMNMNKLQIDGVDSAEIHPTKIQIYEVHPTKIDVIIELFRDMQCFVSEIECRTDAKYDEERLPKVIRPLSTGTATISFFWEKYHTPEKKYMRSDGGLVSSFCLEYDHNNRIETND